MSTIQDLFQQAQLAEAAYANFFDDAGNLLTTNAGVAAALQTESFSESQAIAFVQNWRIVSQFSENGILTSGFSATLFERLSANGQPTRQYALGIRGSNETIDFLADFGSIAAGGVAFDQLLSMVNYVLRLQAGSSGTTRQVELLRDATAPSLTSGVVGGVGPGGISPIQLTLSGHSLGGFLGQVYQRIFGSAGVYTYNSLGLQRPDAPIFDQLTGLLGLPPGNFSSGPGENLLVPGEPAQLVGTVQGKPQILVFSETQSATIDPISTIPAHKIPPLIDSLAIYDLFAKIDSSLNTTDPAVGIGKITDILQSASHEPSKSLESIANSLASFLGLELAPLAGALINDRDVLYQRIILLRTLITNLTANSTLIVDSISSFTSPTDLANIAKGSEALGYRYALKELNPFAILGNNDLYAPHNQNGELDLYNSVNRSGTLTEDWIKDRAGLLYADLIRNTQDNPDKARLPDAGDTATEYRFYSNGKEDVFFADPKHLEPVPERLVAFADDGGRRLIGSDNSLGDALYGGNGTDYLEGKTGQDRLEGGRGLDIYTYNTSRNLGLDGVTWVGDGADTVLDVDGKGVLRVVRINRLLGSVNGTESTIIADASVKLSETQWQSADGKFNYIKAGSDLIITINGDGGGTLTIKDFRNGDLNIRLWEARTNPQTLNEIYGDLKPKDFDLAIPDIQMQPDALGNVIVTNELEANRNDVIYGDRPNLGDPESIGEKIIAGGGNDVIFSDRPRREADNGLGNSDWIIGGAGRDQIEAGAGNDLIEAGADGAWTQTIAGQTITDLGGDIVDGGSGDDEIYAETKITLNAAILQGNVNDPTNIKGDFLYGGAGDDWIIGGRGHDVINGGAGKDLIVGGAGNDTIDGDIVESAAVLNWTAGRAVTNVNGLTDYVVTTTGLVDRPGEVFDVDAGEADVIYGGSGQDWIYARGGDDFVDAGSENDVVIGGAGADILIGGDGIDVLIGDNGDFSSSSGGGDYLDGGAGNDTLEGNGGGDILIGGTGNDTLRGGAGKDIYVFNKGDGIDTVDDAPADSGAADKSVLVLGDGIQPGDIKFRKGSLLIDLGPADSADLNSPHDMIHFEGFDPFDPNSTPVLGEIRFADGTSMGYEDILAQGFDIDGTEENDDNHDADHPMLVGTAVTDRIRGFGGNDVLLGAGGDDVLDGGANSDQLQGGEGNDSLLGGEGDDVLLGENGDDVLDGGAGADTLAGGAGNDTYLADFTDTIIDAEGNNSIQFAADIALDALQATTLSINGENYLVLYQPGATETIPGIPDGLKIKGDIDQLNFSFVSAGGAVVTQQQLLSTALTQDLTVAGGNGDDTLAGYAGDDTLTGYSGNDTLIGGRGDDVLSGYDGSDTYVFNPGDGLDTIEEHGLLANNIPDTQGIDAIRFGAGIASGDVTLTRQADGDLVIAYGSTDRITIKSQYLNVFNAIERIEFDDGTVIDADQLAALPIATITGTESDDVLAGTTADDTLVALAGNDTLDGGLATRFPGQPTGNDQLEGGAGADRYAMYLGMGQDTLVDASATAEETSTLALDAGLTFDSLKSTRDGNDLIVGLRGTQDSARIQGYYDAAAGTQHWQIGLADGSAMPIDDLINRIDPYADNVALQAREDYRQGVLANWSAQSVPLKLPTHALVFQSWSQTTTTHYYNPAFPPLVTVLPPVEKTVLVDYGVRQGNGYAPVYSYQTLITPIAVSQQSDDASIGPVGLPQVTEQNFIYRVSWGNRVQTVQSSGVTTSTVASGPTFLNTTVSFNSTSWRTIGLTLNPVTSFDSYFNVTQINEQRVVEEITAGDSNNNIYTRLGDMHVALVDAGAGDDYVSADWNDFVYGNDGDDTVNGGYLVYGGDGNDNLFSGTNLYGGAGNDLLSGGQIMSGGEGDDLMFGEYGQTRFLINPAEAGEDHIGDGWGIDRREYEYDEALPITWVAANDYAVLEQIFASDLIERDTIAFGSGLNPDDITVTRNADEITLSWGQGKLLHAELAQSGDWIGAGIEQFSFDNGEIWSIREALNRNLVGTATPGDDEIFYSENDDIAFGLGGNDALYGFGGNDTLDGGMGDDYLIGGLGSDTYVFDLGSGHDVIEEVIPRPYDVDTISFGAGITPDRISALRVDGDLVMLVNGTQDQLTISQWFVGNGYQIERVVFADGTQWDAPALESRVISGATLGIAGDDFLGGTPDNDIMFGLNGSDDLSGNEGNDTLDGGAGDDYLDGGIGNDTYVFSLGSGIDTITDASGTDTLAFGAGITPDMLALGLGSLLIEVGDGGDAIHIEGFDPYDVYGSQVIENYEFADGASLTHEELIARGIHIYGSDGDDGLYGTNGPDIIDSGTGNDYLFGDAGNDVYVFQRGDGHDDVYDWDETPGNIDTVRFGADITPDDVTIINDYGDLVLGINGSDDQILLEGWFWDDDLKVEKVVFSDGTAWDIAALEGMVPMAESTADADLIFGTSGDNIIDGLGGDDEIIGGSGNDILSGGEGGDYISGNGGNDMLLGGTGADDLEDWNGNNYFDAGSGDDYVYADFGASFIVGGTGNDWIDNYASGSVIAFNAGDGQDTIYAASSLTLSLGGGIHAADLSLRREGTDLVLETGATDSIRFTRQWEADPEAWPQMTLQLIDGAVSTYDLNKIINQYNGLQNTDSTLITWQIGDALASALLDSSTGFALGGDLAYHYASTGSNDGLAPEIIRGIISDPAFGVEPQPFEALAPTNHAPDIDVPLADQDATEDAPFAFTLPSDAFFDPDTNDALTISATLADGSPLPEWLSFDGANFSGTPENADVDSIEVEVTATDGGGLSVSDAFVLNVVNVNDAPTLANAIAGQDTLEDALFSFVVPADAFADVDVGDVLTYGATLADGSALPAWLSFDAAQVAFSGTPENDDVGTLEVRVTATDQSGAYVANDFTLIVGNTNDAPEVASVIADPSTLEDALFTFTLPADTFADVDVGDALTFSATLADGSPLPAWMTFDPATQAFAGTPGNDEVGTWSIAVTATDTADASVADTFDITVVNVNDAPALINHQQKQWAADGDAMQFQLPGNTFNDIDAGDSLSYEAVLADGSPLPAWLAFDALTRTFSGTPDEADIDTLSLSVTVTDTSGATASDSFDLEVTVAPDRMLIGTGSDDLLSGRSGNDALTGLAGDDVLFGRSGNDRLSGGPGDDLLAGGAGDDTYVYQAGDGLDTIADESGIDTAAFGADLARGNVVARMSGDNTTARVRVLDAYGNEQADQGLDIALDPAGGSPVEWFTFATGAPATLDDLLIRQEVHIGTRRNDVIRTGRNDDAIYADRGNDVVYAGTGNDVLFGDRGRDLLYGEAGNDVLAGGRGKDKLYGGFGDDVLDGGRGTDILDGGAGFNTYIFERNFGDDRIVRGGGSGALRFGAGISARDLSFKRRNDDLVVKVKGDGRIRIEGWFDANAAHPVARAEFADGTVLNADKFVAKGYDSERERDEDDDDEDDSHYSHDDDGARPHGATHNEDRDDVHAKKTAPDRGKSSDRSDNEWFEKVVEKWDAHYARSAQPNAESGNARSSTSHGAQTGNRWQHMHNRLNAHLADGQGDDDNGGADLASLRPGSAHGPSFAQFGSIGYGGVGVADRGAADLRPFSGLKEGLARIA